MSLYTLKQLDKKRFIVVGIPTVIINTNIFNYLIDSVFLQDGVFLQD